MDAFTSYQSLIDNFNIGYFLGAMKACRCSAARACADRAQLDRVIGQGGFGPSPGMATTIP